MNRYQRVPDQWGIRVIENNQQPPHQHLNPAHNMAAPLGLGVFVRLNIEFCNSSVRPSAHPGVVTSPWGRAVDVVSWGCVSALFFR